MSCDVIEVIGSPGPRGQPGPTGTDVDALHVSQRLAEFDTPTAKQQARQSLDLENIDAGTFN